jgi:hypothetical protein
MATPADQRLTELLDRWLTSLELHLKYSSLDDDTYWQVQPWVEHQRPAPWILDLAKQKTAALKAQVEERVKAGDARFSDALEQMMFLANLVGLQQIERFIPIAEPGREQERGDATAATGTREMPRPSTAATGTREMPRPPVKPERKKAAAKSTAKARREPARAPAVPALPVPPPPAGEAARKQVIADAVRLLQWGRRWFELADLIARMADRPTVRIVNRLLNENRVQIEKAATEAKSGK